MEQEQVWDSIAELWSEYKKRSLDEVIEFLKGKKGKVLDLGCGSGRNLIPSAKIKYYGVDFSEEMLKLAEKSARDKKANAVFFQANIEKLPFEDNIFDSAIFISTLHCIDSTEGRENTLRELYRVLKKGGEAMITVWRKEAMIEQLKKQNPDNLDISSAKETFISWKKDGKKYPRYYYFYDKEELQKLLEHVGFEVIKAEISGDEKHAKKNFIFYVKK